MATGLKILFLAAEAAPFAKVGGLADYAQELPQALSNLGMDIRVMIPRYQTTQDNAYIFSRVGSTISVPVGPSEEKAHILVSTTGDYPVYQIWNDQYFANRQKVYGFNDDPQRFVFFSRAVISALKHIDWTPDIIHANDWHTAPVIAWLKVYGSADKLYGKMASLFTIHNLAYQGVVGRLILSFGRMSKLPHLPVEPPGKVNWLAQGIALSDSVSTVSPSYAHEMIETDIGGPLTPLLRERQDHLFGILNGIDTNKWNPETDDNLWQNYSLDNVKMRRVNKAAMQRYLRLAVKDDTPLIGSVSRIDEIKGLDILLPAMEQVLAKEDVQFVFLGVGDESYTTKLQALQEQYPRNVRILIKFDDKTARQIYGSADIFVVPSRLESGSIGLMIAMRYGAVPIVHKTGGLADTVVDAHDEPGRGTGFCFEDYSIFGLQKCITDTFTAYKNKSYWRDIQKRAMERDMTWEASARAYIDLYQRSFAQLDARKPVRAH
ncbi:MAG: glycogen/starch synthase [Anaerolineae bacterium]|nr:glycogen/starch synthase [Anaerolineae bacterium]